MAVDVFCLKKKKQKVLPSCLAIPIGRSVMVKGSRSARVRVRVCTSCKSLGQSGFYSLTWAHKVRFPGGEVSSNPKIIKKSLAMHGSKFIRDAKPIFSSVAILCTILCLFFLFLIKNVWKCGNSYDSKVLFTRKCIKMIFFILKKLFWHQHVKTI